ncbi:MAG: AEC family transporter [Desulfitobacteriaceae bacterium]
MNGDVLIPVFLTVGLGYLAGSILKIETKPISQLSIYVLIPCLVMAYLQKASLGLKDYWLIIIFTIVLSVVMHIVSSVLTRAVGTDSVERSVLQMSVVFMNSSNYGLPVIMLALGQAGTERAVVFITIQLVLLNSLAVFYVAKAKRSVYQALIKILKMPTIWVIILAVILRLFHVQLPEKIWFTLNMLGQASVPVMMLLLGIQLCKTKLAGNALLIAIASGLKLLIAPLVAVAFIYLFADPRGLTERVLILEAAMPTAVVTSLLALEFETKPELVASIVFVTTVLSFVSIPLIISWFIR